MRTKYIYVAKYLYTFMDDLAGISGVVRQNNSKWHKGTYLTAYTYLPTPPLGQKMTRLIFLTGYNRFWIQSFPSHRIVASSRLKNLVTPTILPIAGGRIIGFIPFQGVLVQCEMQSVLSRIWTRVALSIFYDDNHYTLGTIWRHIRRTMFY